jgi:hypothetical protein
MRRVLSAIALSLALVVAGCINDSIIIPTGTPVSAGDGGVTGTYSLRTVNGVNLPFAVVSGPDTVALLDDVVTLTAGGTWTEIGHVLQSLSGVRSTRTLVDQGTYTSTATTITLTSTTPGVATPVIQAKYGDATLTFSGQDYAGGPVNTSIYTK